MSGTGETRDFEIVGIARFGEVNSLGGATFGLFTIPTAQALLDKPDRLDTISVAADAGVGGTQLKAALKEALGREVSVQTGDEAAAEDSADIEEATSFIRYFLLAFGFIALGVGAFVIYNTLTITVAQRIRELATLRALGASAKQVRRSVLIEGLALGILASAVGLVLGYFLASGLSSIFVALGIDLPKTDQVVKARTIIASVAVGVIVTAVASIAPARRATRISPVAAMQEGAKLPEKLGSRRPVAGIVVLVIAAVHARPRRLRGHGDRPRAAADRRRDARAVRGRDDALAPRHHAAVALARGVLAPRRRGRAPRAGERGPQPGAHGEHRRRADDRARARHARRDARRGPAVLQHAGARGAGEGAVRRHRLQRVRHLPVRGGRGRGPGARRRGVRGAPRPRRGARQGPVRRRRARRRRGRPQRLRAAARRGARRARVRDRQRPGGGLRPRRSRLPTGGTSRVTVGALYTRTSVQKLDPVIAKIVLNQATFDESFPRPGNQYVFVGGTPELGALRDALERFPDIEANTRATWVKDRAEGINQLLGLLYVLLALSVIVSLFGMVNTLVLTVFERTREIGMLRAVGMSRRQVRRMVRQESIITALIGAALGLPLGMLLAALMSSALASEGLTFAVPVGSLITFTIVAVLAGVLAAIAPARRAARLDVLKALQYE